MKLRANLMLLRGIAVAVLMVSLAFTTPSHAAFGNCSEPELISLPNDIRTENEYHAAQQALSEYSLEVSTYLLCLQEFVDSNLDRLTKQEKKKARKSYDRLRLELRSSADKWNSLVRDYRESR